MSLVTESKKYDLVCNIDPYECYFNGEITYCFNVFLKASSSKNVIYIEAQFIIYGYIPQKYVFANFSILVDINDES